jgi:hypothetical protein
MCGKEKKVNKIVKKEFTELVEFCGMDICSDCQLEISVWIIKKSYEKKKEPENGKNN